jgi:hypothetical protein
MFRVDDNNAVVIGGSTGTALLLSSALQLIHENLKGMRLTPKEAKRHAVWLRS